MADSVAPQDPTVEEKGKGKAPAEGIPADDVMADDDEDDDSSSDEEEETVEAVTEEDGMEEMDQANIVDSRTRGHTIDYVKAAEENPGDDEDDEDDEDFQPPDEDTKMSD